MITPIASGYMIIEPTVSERPVTWVQVHRILNSNDFVVLNSLVDDIMESHHQSEVFVSMYKAQVDYSTDEVAEQFRLFRTVLDQHDLKISDYVLSMQDKNDNKMSIRS